MFEFSVLINEQVKSNGQRRKHPLADPLDGPEWQGLQWLLRLFERRRAAPLQMPERTRNDAWTACVQPAKGGSAA